MYAPPGVKVNREPAGAGKDARLGAGRSGQARASRRRSVPVPKRAEVLVRIDAVAICATDLEVIAHGPPALDPGRVAVQQELDAGARVHGHGRRAGPRRRRVRHRRPRDGRNPRRLRPMQALPHGHVHVVPELRPQLRRASTRAIAPTASLPTAASPSTPSTTSTP